MVPRFQSRAAFSVPFDRVRITLSRGTTTALDTTVSFPPGADSLVLSLSVPISGAAETLALTLAMINAAGDTVFRGGPVPVTLTTVNTQRTPLPVSVQYVGVGANARSVRIATRSLSLFFRDSVTLAATALDSSGQPIPGTPIAWRSLDTLSARVPTDTLGKVVAGSARGVARIEAMLPTGLADTAQVTVQPVPAALSIVSGNGQSGSVGSALAQPLVVRVKAADSLGVQGVAVSFAVTSGGGSLSNATDTSAATGNPATAGSATTAWTLGSAAGLQSVTATVAGSPSLVATLNATAVAGTASKLAFQAQPSNVAANVAMAPAVQAVAQDTFGNTVTGFTGNVTLGFGANPGGATLGGTVATPAVAGVATFSNLTLNLPGTGYTLVASATGLANATSAGFTVTGGVPTQLAFLQQPSNANGGATIAPAVTVQVRDANGNVVPTATTAVTMVIGTNPGSGTLGGTTTVNAVAGVATFNSLTIDKVGTGYTLMATVTGLTGATSAAFNVAAGAAASLAFTTQPPGSTTAQAAFGFTVTAQDLGGNTATSFTGAVTAAIASNPAGGTPSGTMTQNAVAGVATFSGVSIDNIGSGYTLNASAVGVTAGTSAAFNIVAPAGVNAWINTAGGPWSTATNWSKGTVPVATDSVWIKQSGTYAVTLGANGTSARLDVGAPAGTQTLVLNGHALTVAGNLTTSGSGAVQMTLAADSMQIGGSATFGGGLGTMNAGVIRLAGNFVQTGTGNFRGLAQSASVAHRVVLSGASGTQTISFADPTTSYFRRLWVAKGAGSGVTILTDVRTTYFAQTTGTTGFTGSAGPPITRLFADTIAGIGGGSNLTSPLVIQLGGVSSTAGLFTDSGTVNVDTVVFAGSGQTILASTGPGTITYKSIRIAQTAGTATFAQSASLANDLVVSSGTLALGGHSIRVTGNLSTVGTGALSMTNAIDSLAVGGNASFGGGPSTLSAGNLGVGGNFVQSGAANFAATGTRTTFARLTAGAQTIQFADSVNSFFHELVLNKTIVDTVRLLSNVQVTDSAIVTGSTVLASTAFEALKLPATGTLRVPGTAAVLKPSRIEFGTLQVDSASNGTARILPDTAVFLNGGSITSSSPAYGWKNVRVGGGTLVTTGTVYNGSLIISGGMYTFPTCCIGTDSVKGFLRTEGTGTLQLNSGDGSYYLVVRDSAVFGGGDETGLLANSYLYVGGNFVQRGGSRTFQANANHTTVFDGSGTQTVLFGSPGANLSRFGNVQIARISGTPQPAGITLASNVFLSGYIYDTSTAVIDSIAGQGFTVRAASLYLLGTQFVMNNAPLITDSTIVQVSGLTFRNMSPTVTQWTMNLPAGTGIGLSGLNFQTVPTTGQYFAALMSVVGSNTLTVTSASPPASALTGLYTRANANGSVTVTWNSTLLP